MTKLVVVGTLKRHKETKHSREEIAPKNNTNVSKKPHEPSIPLAVKDNDQSRYSEVHANLSLSFLYLCGFNMWVALVWTCFLYPLYFSIA